MNLRHGMSWLCGSVIAAQALHAAPHYDDYAQGISVEAVRSAPLLELTLPDIVYRTVTRTDLGDIAVFNAEGAAVPISFCASPAAAPSAVAQEPLPVFELQAAPASAGGGARVDLSTSGGTAIQIQEPQAGAAEPAATRTRAHVIDARSVTDALRSIQFEWRSPDDASEARVRIEASDDLDRWQTIVPASTLLQVEGGGQQLSRETIPLPERRYQFLRVARTDGGPPLIIAAALGGRVFEAVAIEPVWFVAENVASTDTREWRFDSARLAPVAYARLLLPEDNMSLRIRLESRGDVQEPWGERWSGETYVIVKDGQRRESAPAQFGTRHDRHWRVLHSATAPSLAAGPTLELGYRPARLQFLAQGSGPFTLAFGSRRSQAPAAHPCGSLLADERRTDQDALIGEAILGAQRTLGGAIAFEPLPTPTPFKRIALWAVLIAGVALLVAMALSLLRRVKAQG